MHVHFIHCMRDNSPHTAMGKPLIHAFITYVALQLPLPLSQTHTESDMHYFQEASKLANSGKKCSVVTV